ncbi:cell division protein ftsj [Coccidioides posadasii str. Silveira]|uniref:rRNA methyltransferase 2, mitochondrial n=2 Tax=Coccidioides posadasii TaxID=199306 RepID=E9DG12_COCPS|nr:cell division protein ftsj [Coccidioides posadasii str. Silveira]KMM68276.1 conserved hypothetical protein, variant [Coccidioides posadasii RMSCC 3488]
MWPPNCICHSALAPPILQTSYVFMSQSRRFASSKQWQARQFKDIYWREANLRGLKSRAAFKLLQINNHYRIFEPGQTVVDLGYAPGSWSQVAVDLTHPNGRVLGIDIIPAQPPKGVSTIQGNFLSPRIQAYIREFLRNPDRGRPLREELCSRTPQKTWTANEVETFEPGYIDRERDVSERISREPCDEHSPQTEAGEGTVDVVLSDMSAPWKLTTGYWKRSLNDPYNRMMNTSGLGFRDHARSMDLCNAAVNFSYDVLKPGGHFICKFYQGNEDQQLELRLKSLFQKVHREKPDSSRKESREAYFIGLKRKRYAIKSDIVL